MNKIVQINVDDIVIDPEAMSDMLTECLKRRRMVRLAGACDIGGVLIASFEDSPVRVKSEFVFAPFMDASCDVMAMVVTGPPNDSSPSFPVNSSPMTWKMEPEMRKEYTNARPTEGKNPNL